MKLKDLKQWIEKLPIETEEYDVTLAVLGKTDDEQYWYRKDDPVYALDIDQETKEILLMRLSAEKIKADEIADTLNSEEGTNENADS